MTFIIFLQLFKFQLNELNGIILTQIAYIKIPPQRINQKLRRNYNLVVADKMAKAVHSSLFMHKT